LDERVRVWSGLVWSGLVWSGLVWSGLVWSGLVWSGLVCSGQVWSSEIIHLKVLIKTLPKGSLKRRMYYEYKTMIVFTTRCSQHFSTSSKALQRLLKRKLLE
jgi:hypothetical protein